LADFEKKRGKFESDITLLQANVLYSGADDAVFAIHDLKSSPDSPPVHANRKAHGAGVTTILPHPKDPGVVLTGSYDDKLRMWDVRNLSKPLETCQVSGHQSIYITQPYTATLFIHTHAWITMLSFNCYS
jgi:WD40 repeat protein